MPGEPPCFDKWTDFYRHVYDPIVKDAEKHAEIPIKARKQMTRIHERLEIHVRKRQ